MSNIENQIPLLANTLSEFAGRMSAMDATLRGILAALSGQPKLYEAVVQEIEKEYASHLQVSQNSIFIEEFEAQADTFRALLQAPK